MENPRLYIKPFTSGHFLPPGRCFAPFKTFTWEVILAQVNLTVKAGSRVGH